MTDSYFPRHATDAHEDRWNRLDLSQQNNTVGSISFDGEVQHTNPSNASNKIRHAKLDHHQQEPTIRIIDKAEDFAPGQDPIASIARKNDELNHFYVGISREFDDIKRLKSFPGKYNRFPISNSISLRPEGYGIVPIQKIPETLRAYHGRINALEGELDARENETLKLNEIIRLLMGENTYLKNHVEQKTKDFQKAFQTMQLNDSEIVHDLNHRIKLLTEENNILNVYLEEVKGLKSSADKTVGDKSHELEKTLLEYKNTRNNLNEALIRESTLTHENQTTKIKLQKAKEKTKKYKEGLKEANKKIEKLEEKQEFEGRSSSTYKRQTQEKDQKYQVEIHELTQTNASLQNDNAELNRIIQAQQKIIEDNKKEIKKLRRDLDDIKLEDEDYVQKMQAAKNEVAHINSEKEAAVKSSRHYEAKCINLEEQIHELKQSLETAQNNYITTSAALEELRKQHNLKSASYHQQINEMKDKSRESTNERDEAILNLYDRINKIERDLAISTDPLYTPEATKREIKKIKNDINKYLPKEESLTPTPLFKPNYDLEITKKPLTSYNGDLYAAKDTSSYDTLSIPATTGSAAKQYQATKDTESIYNKSPISYGLYDKNSTHSSTSKFDTLGSPKEDYHLSAERFSPKKHYDHYEIQQIVDGVLKKNKSSNNIYEGLGPSVKTLAESASAKSILKNPQATQKYSPSYSQSSYSLNTNARGNAYLNFLEKV